jgi:hypothetical protein
MARDGPRLGGRYDERTAVRALLLAIVALTGCASSESVWPRARKPQSTHAKAIAPRICICPPKEGMAQVDAMGVPPAPPVIRRYIFGDFFVGETIDKLEAHYGVPLETTLVPLVLDFEPTADRLAQVKSMLPLRLPLALASATAALIVPNAELLNELRRIRGDYDDAVASGDVSMAKTKRAELWRAYRAGLDLLHEVAISNLIGSLTYPSEFSERPSERLTERVARDVGIPEYAAVDILRAAGIQYARRRAVLIVAGSELGALVDVHRPSLATYVTFP